MTQVRKNQRFYIKDTDHFLVQVEANPGRKVDCFLNDISVSGACIILDKQVFLQREKEYPFVFLEQKENGEFEKVADVKGKMAWYLSKEFKNTDMLFLGIEFQSEITLPESITNEKEVLA